MEGRGGGGDGSDAAVELRVEIAASPATVWRCVTRSDLLSRWLSAGVTMDARVGGAVRIDFARHRTVVEGVVEELLPERALAFSWGVTEGTQAATLPAGSTRVRILLAPSAAGTLVTLRHEGLPSEQARRDHAMGWTGYLHALSGVAPLAAIADGPEGLWDLWFSAWGETDAGARDALLARCATDDVAMADAQTAGCGRAWLSRWIALCQGMFPGVRIARDGAVLHAGGSLLVRWRIAAADGSVVGTGWNHGRLSLDGRLAAVEGFREG